MTPLTDRFDRALVFAHEAHRTQARKSTSIPYISHLMAVASLVLEAGGDEDLAIAGLLHDVLEDTPVQYETVADQFGQRVADIVRDCSDTEVTPKPPWRERKEAYLAQLAGHSPDSVLVSNADKIHNARSILSDYREHGEALWDRFNAGRDDQLWYYGKLVEAYTAHSSPLASELELVVDELKRLVEAARD